MFAGLCRIALTFALVLALTGIGLPMHSGTATKAFSSPMAHSQHHHLSDEDGGRGPVKAGSCCDVMAGQCVTVFSSSLFHSATEPRIFFAGVLPGGSETIRDFIAFPKNNAGRDVMIDAPATIDDAQLKELNLKVTL